MSSSPTSIIIDTDPGVDDAVALLAACASADAEILGVSTVFGNVPLPVTTVNARRILALGACDVPVAAGAGRPLVHPQQHRAGDWHGADGLGGRAETLPAPTGELDRRSGVRLLADLLVTANRPVTLVAIGPLTNIALLLASFPEVHDTIERLVVMGGSLSGGNVTGSAEFNVHCDPEAARRVLVEERVPTTVVPLDLTMRCTLDARWLADLAAAGPRCALLAGVMEHYRAQFRARHGRDEVAVHDALAVLEALAPGSLHTTPLRLDVACDQGPARGAVVAGGERADTRPVDVALDADLDGVRGAILDRLRRLDAGA